METSLALFGCPPGPARFLSQQPHCSASAALDEANVAVVWEAGGGIFPLDGPTPLLHPLCLSGVTSRMASPTFHRACPAPALWDTGGLLGVRWPPWGTPSLFKFCLQRCWLWSCPRSTAHRSIFKAEAAMSVQQGAWGNPGILTNMKKLKTNIRYFMQLRQSPSMVLHL